MGSSVRFKHNGRKYAGILIRITKRGTVLLDSTCNEHYEKFYIPLEDLTLIPELHAPWQNMHRRFPQFYDVYKLKANTIIGSIRSEEGPANYACASSLLEAWKYQGKDQFKEMQRVLEYELCLKD